MLIKVPQIISYFQTITFLLYINIHCNVQSGHADVGVQSEIKIGVCDYKSKSDPLQDAPQDVIRRNVKSYVTTIKKAKSENTKLVVFPEGGLTTLAPFRAGEIHDIDVFTQYSLEVSDWKHGCPCIDDKWISKGTQGEAIRSLSCAAISGEMHVVVNILEKESMYIYNTNLVFNDTGHIIKRYRKNIPGISSDAAHYSDNDNKFNVADKTFKTIIGNDIYNERYNFSTSSTVSIVWSTASKLNCREIPALTISQIFGRSNRTIFIADYGDDHWSSSSCIYYDGQLYSANEELTDDQLIVVPPNNGLGNRKRKLNTGCFTNNILNSSKNGSDNACQINDQGNNKYRRFYSNSTPTEYNDLEVSLCGIIIDKDRGNTGLSPNDKNISAVPEDKFNFKIVWQRDKSYKDYFLPISSDIDNWPLKNNSYKFENNLDEPVQMEYLQIETELLIFAVMRIRNTTSISDSKISTTEIVGDKSDGTSSNISTFAIIIIVIIVIIIIALISVGLWFLFRYYKSKNGRSKENIPSEVEMSEGKPFNSKHDEN